MINLRQNGTGQKLNIDTSPLYQHIHSLETNTSFLQHQIKSISSQTNNNNQYYESNTNMITDIQRNFIYNFRDTKYSAFKNYKVYNGLMDINNTSFLTPNITFNCVDIVNNELLCMSNGIIKCNNFSSCTVKTPYMNIDAYSAINNSLYGTIKNFGLDAKIINHGNNLHSNFHNLNLNIVESATSNVFNKITHLNLEGNKIINNTFTTCDFINNNCYDMSSNSFDNVRFINCVAKNLYNNTYTDTSNYQCQFMNVVASGNEFSNPGFMNASCKLFMNNNINSGISVDVKCDLFDSNSFNSVHILNVHNVNSLGLGTYSNINEFYLENFKPKINSDVISNVTSFRFKNGSSNLYNSDLNWTLTNSNYNFVESNVVQCGDFNPIPYIRSINQHLNSIESKLTQISQESDVFVKKINVSNLAENTTFSSADSLKINCLTVQNFNCSDISNLKINGVSLESGMFSNIKSVELNVNYCNELTFDNVEYIKVNCINTTTKTYLNINPNIYCSNIGTIKINKYNKIQLQKFNLFEAPHPNNYFYSCYMSSWNANAPQYNPYDAHYMTDYTYNSDSYATVKFKFNVDTFKQAFLDTTIYMGNTITTQRITTNKLLFWTDNTFKLGNAVEYVNNTGLIETADNVLTNYQMQFDMPYITTTTNYYN